MEGEPHDTTLEKTDYRDKVTSVIAAKAKAIAGDVTHHGQYHHNLLTMIVVSILIHFCD